MKNSVRSVIGVTLALALLASMACSKSVEGESKRWDRGITTVNRLAAEYPGFKNALEEQKKAAVQAMDAAKQVSDQEQKIDAMSKANNLLSGGFVGQLDDVEDAKKRIRKKISDVSSGATDESLRLSARTASDTANRIVSEAESRLRQGAPDAAAARTVLQRVTDELRQADNALDKVARAVNKKEAAEKEAAEAAAAAKAGKDGTDGKAGTTGGEAARWTCTYCEHSNAADAETCGECGAKRP